MRRIVVLLGLFLLIATPAVGRAQARPHAVLGAPAGALPVLPGAGAPGSSQYAFGIDVRFTPRESESLQERRPSLLQHIGLGALGGFVIGAATGMVGDDEFYPGIAGAGAVLGAIVGVVIWNIRVMP